MEIETYTNNDIYIYNYESYNINYIINCKKYINNIIYQIEKLKILLYNNNIIYDITLKIHKEINYIILYSNFIIDSICNLEHYIIYNNNLYNLYIDNIEANIYIIEDKCINNIIYYLNRNIEESTIIECNTNQIICHLNNNKVDYIEDNNEISFTKYLIPQAIKYGDYTDYITITEDNDKFQYISFVIEIINKNIIKIKVYYVNNNIEDIWHMKDIDESNYVKYNITLYNLNTIINEIM